MKKILFIILVLIGVGAYFALNKTKGEIDILSGDLPLPNSEGTIVGTYSLKNIIDQELPYECTMGKSDETSRVLGNIFISGDGKIRGDFDLELVLPEETPTEIPRSFASHLIVDGDTAYTWTSLQPIGYKTKVAKSATKNASTEEQSQIVGIDDELEYECKPWNANLTVFIVPTGISFSELEQN
jgi:hypothetical protein